MKQFSFLLFAFLIYVVGTSVAEAAKTVHVRGYTRKDGTYVSPHYRSPPGGGSSSSTSSSYSYSPRTSYRTEPRTTIRGTDFTGDDEISVVSKPVETAAQRAARMEREIKLLQLQREQEEKRNAEEARQAAAKAEQDRLTAAQKREDAAKSKLFLAKKFHDKKEYATARRWLNEVIEQYPNTQAAEQAWPLLKSLP